MFLIDSFCGFYFHSKELKDPEEVNVVHPLDAQRGISVEDFRLIKLHMSNCMFSLDLITLLINFQIGFNISNVMNHVFRVFLVVI
jgi:hypothetical protein